MLVVYDNKGTIYYCGTGYPQPEGIPFLNVEVPEGQYLDSIDVSQEPHKPIFKEYPKSEMEILKEKVATLENTVSQVGTNVEEVETVQTIMLTGTTPESGQ